MGCEIQGKEKEKELIPRFDLIHSEDEVATDVIKTVGRAGLLRKRPEFGFQPNKNVLLHVSM